MNKKLSGKSEEIGKQCGKPNWLTMLFLRFEARQWGSFSVKVELTNLLNEKSLIKSVVKGISAVMRVWNESRKTVVRVRKRLKRVDKRLRKVKYEWVKTWEKWFS